MQRYFFPAEHQASPDLIIDLHSVAYAAAQSLRKTCPQPQNHTTFYATKLFLANEFSKPCLTYVEN